FLIISLTLQSQSPIDLDLNWKIDEGKEFLLLNEGYDSGNLPVVFRRIPLNEDDSLSVQLQVTEEKKISGFSVPDHLTSSYRIRTYTETEKGQKFGTIFLYPLKSASGSTIDVLI